MSVPFLACPTQMQRICSNSPLAHGVPWRDGRRIIGSIVLAIRGGLRRHDAPPGYGPHRTLHNRFVRWSRMGVLDRIFAALAGEAGEPGRLIIDSTHLKAHRTAANLLRRGRSPPARASQGWTGPQAARRLRRPAAPPSS